MITFSNEGLSRLFIILAISLLCSSIPIKNAGIKWLLLIFEKGGISNSVSYLFKKGLSMAHILEKLITII